MISAFFISCGERIIQVVVKASACKDKPPAFHTVARIAVASKTGFIISDRFIKLVVHCYGYGWPCIVEIKYGNLRKRIFYFGMSIGDILCDQVFEEKIFFGFSNHFRKMMLPFDGNTAKIRLVADLVHHIIIVLQLTNDLTYQLFLYGKKAVVFIKRIYICSR